jgi:uncharacterized protein (TIGR00369 family)
MVYKILRKQNNSAMCFVCGTKNESGLKARFYDCEKEDGEQVLLTVVEPKDNHQSYPNRMHGGVSASLLDEAIGRALWVTEPNVWGVTIDLSVKYRKPVPLDQTIYVESKITAKTARSFEGEGKIILADGTVCATASGKYFICPPEKISEAAISHENWYYVDEELSGSIKIM